MLNLRTDILFAVTAIVSLIGGLIVFNGTVDIALHDTMLIIDEKHLVFVVSGLLMLCSLVYFLFLKSNKPLSEKWGRVHFMLTFLSVFAGVLTFMYIQGKGVNRYTDTVDAFEVQEKVMADLQFFQGIIIMFFVAQFLFSINIVTTLAKRK